MIVAVWWVASIVLYRGSGAIPTPPSVVAELVDGERWATTLTNAASTVSAAGQGYLWGNLAAVALAVPARRDRAGGRDERLLHHRGLLPARPARRARRERRPGAAYGGSAWTVLRKVRAIAALPSLFAALKIAAPAAFLGAILAEYLGSGGDATLGIATVTAVGFVLFRPFEMPACAS